MIQFRDSQDNFAFFISLTCHSSTSACFIILFCSLWNPYLDLVGKMRICLCFPEPKPTSRNMVWQCGSKYYNCQALLQLQLQLIINFNTNPSTPLVEQKKRIIKKDKFFPHKRFAKFNSNLDYIFNFS